MVETAAVLAPTRVAEVQQPSDSVDGRGGVSEAVSRGRAVQVVTVDKGDHSFNLDEAALVAILTRTDVKELPVCIVAVAGAFRRGKSFLLDFLLRYLESTSSDGGLTDSISKGSEYDGECDGDGGNGGGGGGGGGGSDPAAAGDWLGGDDQPLTGFHWRGGSERDTTGILLWSEPFVLTNAQGKRIAVLLMDTQGAFDSNSTVRDCATVFALSAMLSSVLVYNLTANIQEDDLWHLELFTEFGRLALEEAPDDKPFQKLLFLIRDWTYPYEAAWGEEGGQKILERRLQISAKQRPELQKLRNNINACFKPIECFLMPHPGLQVATDPDFRGQLKDIESNFKTHLRTFVPLLLAPDNVDVKKIGGNEVKCKEIVEFFKAYIEIFKGDEMPEPKTMLEATSEANNLASLSTAKDTYQHLMEAVCGGDKPYINEHILEIEHCKSKDQAVEVFGGRRKMGGEQFSAKYREQLEREIDECYGHYQAHNESKNIFRAANTPITYGAIAMMAYVLSQVFSLIGLYSVANILNILLMFCFTLMAVWCYAKYTGDFREIGSSIDGLAATLWDSVIQPLFKKVAVEGTQLAAQHAVRRMNSTSVAPSAAGLASPLQRKVTLPIGGGLDSYGGSAFKKNN